MSPTERPTQPVERPGEHTEQSLAELLGIKEGDDASDKLRQDLERIGEAERAAERAAAAARLYGAWQPSPR